jgi:hypothetical protein
MMHMFEPHWESIHKLHGQVETATIVEEPMLFSTSPDFAESYGGSLTRAVLRALSRERDRIATYISEHPGTYAVIDTRSHMLMPGQYPAIPGWHCDAYPRGKGSSGQPDLKAGDPECFHYVVTVSDQPNGVSNTTFMQVPLNLNVDPERVWGSVHDAVEALGIGAATISDGHLIRFKQETLHRATRTHTKGWRWFFRMSMYHSKPMNQIRRQVQVYSTEGGGW